MNINITWHGNQFNVGLSSKDGAENFLEVKGCRLVDGKSGVFVSWPATKNQSTGKYWAHCWASEKFAAVVLSKAIEAAPKKQAKAAAGDDAIPF